MTGKSLELYFVDGRPDGMLTAEVFNWTGHILMTPRIQVAKALTRPEATRTGVYILVGEIDGIAAAYIGEADALGRRIRDHVSGKDWWTSAVLVSTAGDSLHKAHVKYLEARLIEMAREVGSIRLDNSSTPARASLSEAHVANMESFLETLLMVLPALRIDMFVDKRRATPPKVVDEVPEAPLFELVSKKHGLHATARLEEGEFVVLAGSSARLKWMGNTATNIGYQKLHAALVASGVLKPEGDICVFVSDYAFSSTSAASDVVKGYSTSGGPTEWKVKGTNTTYRQWEEQQLQATEAAA